MRSRAIPCGGYLRSVLVAVAVLASPVAALAQKGGSPDPEAVAVARELMVAAGATKQFDAVLPAMVNQISEIFIRQQPAHAQSIREAMQGVATRMTERKDELIVQIAGLYATQFSLPDLKELTRFFTSDLGKRFVAGQSAILPQSMALGQRWGAAIGREVDAEMRKELRKRGVPI